MSKQDVIDFLYEIINHDIPFDKFSPCRTCGQNANSCCGCDKYTKWEKYINNCPITSEEQEAIDFINEIKHICTYD